MARTSVFATFLAAVAVLTTGAPIVPALQRNTISLDRPKGTVTENGVWIPHGFEAFEKTIVAYHGSSRQVATEKVDCPEVEEPSVPTVVPGWAAGTPNDMRAAGVQEVLDHVSGAQTGAFISGADVVLKQCTASALESVVKSTGVSWADKDPSWDIYFDCAAGQKWTIRTTSTLLFGKGNKEMRGSWRLLAPHFNVVLHGRGTHRIMEILSNAHVVVYGLEFKRGSMVMEQELEDLSQIPDGGWNGGAVLVFDMGALTAYKCKFNNNRAESYYARWGGGGAIKVETGSYAKIWECAFQNNRASVGGAIATSSSTVLYIRKTTFLRNSAYGGVDGSDVRKNRLKPLILVRGAAIRIDSVKGHESSLENVLLCNSNFVENKLIFTMDALVNKFGYTEADDLQYVRAAGTAVTTWNSEGKLNHAASNHHLLQVKGCVFSKNEELVEPEGDKFGRYVFEVEGAGHCEISDTKFRDNIVHYAVAKLDNSDRFDDGMAYQMKLRKIDFERNGSVYNMEFEAHKYASTCTFDAVDGIHNGTGDCKLKILEAIEQGGNLSVTSGDSFDHKP